MIQRGREKRNPGMTSDASHAAHDKGTAASGESSALRGAETSVPEKMAFL